MIVQVREDSEFEAGDHTQNGTPYILFSPLDFEDNISISFTEDIFRPVFIMNYTSENDGNDAFNITYHPS